ncbi:unnamed protein product [Phytophthora fragariaefolia]|uniref:Unnamed protein product n=1 Tax=Phytophthora fragariaefolia TaxID=1490495 RepID=A0A9W7D1P9_9STRA|nr:unnamed protein product [Phytophthora fragariaefolia]
MGYQALKAIQERGAVQGLKSKKDMETYGCVPCEVAQAKSMSFGPKKQLPFELWGEALLIVIDTINVTPSRVIEGKSPHEMIYEEKPDVSHLRTWGCAVDVFVMADKNRKMEKLKKKKVPGLLIGYPHKTKGYKWMSAIDGKIRTAQGANITFREGYTIAKV